MDGKHKDEHKFPSRDSFSFINYELFEYFLSVSKHPFGNLMVIVISHTHA
jgi:hypothetical protein